MTSDETAGQRPVDERVEALALKLLRSPTENGLEPGDKQGALLVARRMLEDSNERINDPATTDPESDEVIRRTSGETSAIGDTLVRRSTPTAE